ncbi:cyclin-dependent protein kinase [Trypanosoma conorhini]|uniref:Cyclin-dependent protein kinase n=1 Tax=Trypanosoma conorhini TaxID=83891 RepID=A0A422PVP7_9TRYP|nr:cyclin-dependent protein kinase [Trypanosoma conorhini]RNF21814.1 cyclin-dependent protein kinase [Trypanosoma conorhini]
MEGGAGSEGLVNFLSLEVLDAAKPLIGDFFRPAHQVAMQRLFKRHALNCSLFDLQSSSSQQGLSQSSVSVEHDDVSRVSCAALLASEEPRRLKLFVLSPSVAEPPRYCRTGLLGEAESLHAKHAVEYEFLVPAISSAVESVIAAHAKWQQRLSAREQRGSGVELTTKTLLSAQTNVEAAAEGSTHAEAPAADAEATQDCFTCFETNGVPAITFPEYMHRIVEYTFVSPSVLLVACIYLDRLLTRRASLLLTNHNVFKLFAAATRVASKVMDARTVSNKSFARVCGLRNTEMNFLESRFMRVVELDLYVSAAEFYSYVEDLVTTVPVKAPASKRADPCAAGSDQGGKLLLPIVRQVSASSISRSGSGSLGGQKKAFGPLPPVAPLRCGATPGTSLVFSPRKGANGGTARAKDGAAEVGGRVERGSNAVVMSGAAVPPVSVKSEEVDVGISFRSRSMTMPAPVPRNSRLSLPAAKELKGVSIDVNNVSIDVNNVSSSRHFNNSAAVRPQHVKVRIGTRPE